MTPREKGVRFEGLRAIGCLCCRMADSLGFKPTGLPVELHHQNQGGKAGQKRVGDHATVPLCWWHHRSSFTAVAPPSGWDALVWLDKQAEAYGPGLAAHSRRFRQTYGNDAALLAMADELLAA